MIFLRHFNNFIGPIKYFTFGAEFLLDSTAFYIGVRINYIEQLNICLNGPARIFCCFTRIFSSVHKVPSVTQRSVFTVFHLSLQFLRRFPGGRPSDGAPSSIEKIIDGTRLFDRRIFRRARSHRLPSLRQLRHRSCVSTDRALAIACPTSRPPSRQHDRKKVNEMKKIYI